MAYHSNFVAQNHIVAQLHIVAQWWMVQEQNSVTQVVLTRASDSIPPSSSYNNKKHTFFQSDFAHISMAFLYDLVQYWVSYELQRGVRPQGR